MSLVQEGLQWVWVQESPVMHTELINLETAYEGREEGLLGLGIRNDGWYGSCGSVYRFFKGLHF